MKKILVATDLSPAAENAARYALHLAYYLQVNIELLHTFEVPATSLLLQSFTGNVEKHQAFKNGKIVQLNDFVKTLDKENREVRPDLPWIPQISSSCEEGKVFEMISHREDFNDINFLTIGISSAGKTNGFFFGSKIRKAINKTGLPILIVPALATFKKINKIVFATDFMGNDLEILALLSDLVRPFNAEILIVHVKVGKERAKDLQQKMDTLIVGAIARTNYHRIYYRNFTGMTVEEGLSWIVEHGQTDVLAMEYREDALFHQLFKESHTMKMVDLMSLPMLIFKTRKDKFL
ncbi:universal stress protein [Pedobacter polysacchareus]|uniref:universal stress protein n=1 Tax=Pedobacter polysacchareus TaxID=2861973 RepID=UPI001C98EB93|nr:universal stress protein [Pedobacter polysacchareus]